MVPLGYLAFCGFLYAIVFFAELSESVLFRRVATFLTVFGSGIGAVILAAPSKFNYPDYSMFVRLQDCLLGSIDTILALTIFLLVLHRSQRSPIREGVLIGLILGFLLIVHPYAVIVIYGTLLIFALWEFGKENRIAVFDFYLIALAVSLPAALFQSYSLGADPSFSLWFFHGMLTERYLLGEYLLGFGLLVPLAFLGFYLVIKDKHISKSTALLIIWTFMMLVGVFQEIFPSIARRLGETLIIPIAYFASIPLMQLISGSRAKQLLAVSMFIITMLGSVLYYITYTRTYAEAVFRTQEMRETPNDKVQYQVLSVPQKEALSWLNLHAGPSDVILSGGTMGGVIPAYVNTRVIFGHPSLMPELTSMPLIVPRIMNNIATSSRAWNRFLTQVTYVVYDDELRALTYPVNEGSCLRLVFTNSDISIYEVNLNACE